jgi:ribonuclease HI
LSLGSSNFESRLSIREFPFSIFYFPVSIFEFRFFRMAKSPELIAHIDGASRGNPGPAACAVVMESPDGSQLAAFSHYLGRATNNVAEYRGLLAALEYALRNHYLRVRVQTDSELLALQIEGVYKVKNPGLRPLEQQARQMIARLESFSIEHVPRERNSEADRLANRALDAAQARKRHQVPAPPPLAPLSLGGGESGVEERPPLPPPVTPLPIRAGESGAGDAAKVPGPLRASATFHKGVLEPHAELPLSEGEVVDLEIHRKK